MASRAPGFLARFRETYKVTRYPWKKHVLIGTDLDGNEYWEMPNPLGGRPKRWVQMKDHDDYAVYNQNLLPVQWQAWLRHTRPVAPTTQELIREVQRRNLIQQRAKQLEQDWQQRKQQLQQEHDKAAQLESQTSQPTDTTTQPTGQGDTFVPGEWNPSQAAKRR
ncbi:hypothetical protein DM01DRAFT_1366805 [Hesseltinella vesiculosa]|uniref:NADH dehydrogenase [ubiquinone] 1 alpha subcomplex subunit n=1 Tax=Hesseltinella vesiculosa TaxID=101127 RepID=A0A1X2GMR4_9FUNG|nr:hypothetical protein DM01DRAFT_1366805 [Hesseltinella vesiculosa]